MYKRAVVSSVILALIAWCALRMCPPQVLASWVHAVEGCGFRLVAYDLLSNGAPVDRRPSDHGKRNDSGLLSHAFAFQTVPLVGHPRAPRTDASVDGTCQRAMPGGGAAERADGAVSSPERTKLGGASARGGAPRAVEWLEAPVRDVVGLRRWALGSSSAASAAPCDEPPVPEAPGELTAIPAGVAPMWLRQEVARLPK